MRVLLITRFFYPIDRPSGVISLVREVASELIRQGNQVAVACVRKSGEKDYYLDNSGIEVLKFSQKDPASLRRLAKVYKAEKVIVCSSISSGFVLALWWLIMLLGSGLLSKTVFYQTTNPSVGRFSKLIIRSIMRLSSNCAVANHSILNVLGLSQDQANIIVPGVDPKDYLFEVPRKLRASFRVCFMGHLSEIKGADRVLDIAQSLPDIEFRLIAGFSPGRDNMLFYDRILQRIASLPNAEHFEFCDNPIELLSDCDLLILPYRDGTTVLGVAQSAIEAMAFGIPVMATNNNAVDELLHHDVNGMVLENVADFTVEIKRLSCDEIRYIRYSKMARDTVVEKFAIDSLASKLLT